MDLLYTIQWGGERWANVMIISMFDQSRTQFQELVIKVQHKGVENSFIMSVLVSSAGEVYIWDILRRIKEVFQLQEPIFFFYYDHLQATEVCLHSNDHCLVHHSSLINDNMISLRAQTQISDELLANPDAKNATLRVKRSPQRFIYEAFEVVELWRQLYREGNKKESKERVNLDKAAEIVDIPRKTLEDYYLLMRNGVTYGFQFATYRRQKIGVLRSYIREKRKQSSATSDPIKPKEQIKFFQDLRRVIFGLTELEKEEDLFKVMEIEDDCHGSSDEDMAEDLIFEN